MRCSLAIAIAVAALVVGCAAPPAPGRVCTNVSSWGAPAYHCEVPPPPALLPPPAAPPPAPPPPPPPPEIIQLNGTVEFELNSTKLLDKSTPVLDDVVQKMKDHPEILRVEVQGHTDSQGPHDYNVTLSDGCAASVLKYPRRPRHRRRAHPVEGLRAR